MISREVLRRFPYFAGLSPEQIVTLARVADEISVEANHYFFHAGDNLESFYLVLAGTVAVAIEIPDRAVKQNFSAQLTRELQTTDVVISTVQPGEIFGWSALVAPYKATASGKATSPCRVVAFDCHELRNNLEDDCQFGHLMMKKISQTMRDRLHNMRIEFLHSFVE